MHHPTDRIAHTTAFVTPVVEHWLEREIAQWVQPMKDRSDDPSHHQQTLLPRSYISLPTGSPVVCSKCDAVYSQKFILSRTEVPAKVGTCAHDRRALNVHVNHFDLNLDLDLGN